MDMYRRLRPLLFRMEAEKAHRLALRALESGFYPRRRVEDSVLRCRVLGMDFSNPLGMAAGFDKEARVIAPLINMGFGFVEAGTVTLRPQYGNLKPRLFRDAGTQSIINRLGFPGGGMMPFRRRLVTYRARHDGIVGVNIGINKETKTPLEDYAVLIEAFDKLASYIAVNISSPNTQGLRDLQARAQLDELLAALQAKRQVTGAHAPLLVKIAPDLTPAQREDIAQVCLSRRVDGLIVSNTTMARPSALPAGLRGEAGGLSGPLLRELSTAAIADMYRLTQGRLPIIGVGGVGSGQDAYEKIRAGASLVQLYTALVFQGPLLVARILEELAALLRRDGFAGVSAAVGTGQDGAKGVV